MCRDARGCGGRARVGVAELRAILSSGRPAPIVLTALIYYRCWSALRLAASRGACAHGRRTRSPFLLTMPYGEAHDETLRFLVCSCLGAVADRDRDGQFGGRTRGVGAWHTQHRRSLQRQLRELHIPTCY